MLQSIGMTSKQVMRVLMLEGMMYILLTTGITLTIGSALCYLGLGAFVSGSSYMKLHFTVVPAILCLPVLLLIAIIVPVISQNSVCKNNVVERLREAE